MLPNGVCPPEPRPWHPWSVPDSDAPTSETAVARASVVPTVPAVPLPVVRATTGGPHRVELVLAVGQRDEPPQLAGITHLAEHLVIRLAGMDATFKDGETGLSTVSFSTTGTAEGCLDFARRIAAAIADVDRLTDAEVALELDIVEREDPLRFAETIPSLSTIRWGLDGIGLHGAGCSTLPTITRDEVVAWVRRWFTGDHAAVVLSGPWGSEVEPALELPGPPPGRRRRAATPSGLETPVAVTTPLGGAALSLVVPVTIAPALGQAAGLEFFLRLRHDAGLAYEVDVLTERLDADTVQLDVVVGAGTERAREAAVALVDLARAVADRGFSALAVDRARLSATLLQGDRDARADLAARDAVHALLLGHPASDLDVELDRGACIAGDDLREAWSHALRTAVVMVDEDADLGDPEDFSRALGMPFDDLAPAVAIGPREAARAFRRHRTWRNAVLPALASDRVALVDDRLVVRSGDRGWTVAIQDLSVAVASDDEVVLVMRDGRRLRIERDGWFRGASLLAATIAAVERLAPDRLRRRPSRTASPSTAMAESTT